MNGKGAFPMIITTVFLAPFVEEYIYRNCIFHVQITPKEVFQEYESNPLRWKKQEQLEIQLLQILKKRTNDGADPQKIVENLKEMVKNADEDLFSDIVRKNTNGPNAEKGGKMGWIERDKLRPEFTKPLKNARKGMIVGPIDTPEGFYFIRVCDLAGEEKIPFEKAASQIEQELKEKAIQIRKKIYLHQIKEGAVIRMLL